MAWFLIALSRYATFDGRSRRREYWGFMAFYVLLHLLVTTLGALVGPRTAAALSFAYEAVLLVPAVAVGVRRLHDTGRSGMWMLLGLVPVVGTLALVYFLVQDSEPGDNEYGPNPKGVDAFAYATAASA